MAHYAFERSAVILVAFFLLSNVILDVVALQAGPAEVPDGRSLAPRALTSRDGPDEALFKDPPNEYRVMPIVTQKTNQTVRDKYASLGIGGMVINNWNWDDASLKDAKDRNWTMWVNDYYMYPSGNANPVGGVHERFWNPGMESHKLGFWPDGWQWTYADWPIYDLTGTKSHSGSAAVSVDSANFFYWAIGVKPGVEYNLSAWARQNTNAESGYLYIMWFNVDQNIGINFTAFQTGPEYQKFSLLARAPANANVGRIFIQGVQRNQYVWFDDVMIRQDDRSIANILLNPGLETDADLNNVPDGWWAINTPGYDKTGSISHSGMAAVTVNSSYVFAQGVTVTEGKDYYLGAWMRAIPAWTAGQVVVLWLHDTNIIGLGQTIFMLNNFWSYEDFIYQSPAGANGALVVLASASNSYVVVDDVKFYQAPALNDGVSRGPILDGHPELEAQGLYYSSQDIYGGQTSNLSVPSGKVVLVLAAVRYVDGSINLTGATDLTAQVSGGLVKWTAPSGLWRVMAFSYDILYNGTECDPAISNMHQINVMNKVAVQRFIDVMYNQTIYQKTSEYWGNMIKASFTDEVSNLAAYFIPQDRPVVAWLHDDVNKLYLTDTFQELHGYDLMPYLPALWNDVGPRTVKYRIDFYNTTAYLQGQAYYKMIGDWCAGHGMNFSGHQLAEDSLLVQTAVYGDYFESAKYMGYPGIDALMRSTDTLIWDTDTITPKMASSTAVLYGKPHVMTEYSVGAGAMNYREMTAVANWQMVQGIDRVTSFSFPVGAVPDADLKRHSEQVGRTSYMLGQGRYTSEIGVLYPITSIQGEYVPLNTTIWNSSAFPAAVHDYSFVCMTRNMLEAQLDFIYINDENLVASSVTNETGTVSLHHDVSGLDMKVLVIPEMYTIRTSTMERIKAFFDSGGIVVAVGDLPTASAENGTDQYIASLVDAVFDMSALGSSGYNKRTNGNGGVSIRGDGKVKPLETPLRAAMKEDLLLPEPQCKGIYYQKRTGEGFELYLLVNNGIGGYINDTKFRTLGDPSLWDPETGNVNSVPASWYSYDPATGYTTIRSLSVPGRSSVFVVFDKPVLSLGPEDLVFDPITPIVGTHVSIKVNVSNIGTGIAPQVNVKVYEGDPDAGGDLIGGTDTLTIGPGSSEQVSRDWDTTARPGLWNITAVACLPDGGCVKAQKGIFVNSRPVAAVLANRTEAYTFESFNFTSNSTDRDGPINNTTWDLGDGTLAYTRTVLHEYSENGTYTVILKVEDSNGTWAQTSLLITVLNRDPVASFFVAPGMTGNCTTQFVFNASGSSDRDGTIAGYQWDVGDGTKALRTGMVLNYTYPSPGNYTIILTARDNDGASAKTNRTISVINLAPIANFTYSPGQGNVTTNFEFTSTSSDPEMSTLTYNWSFGDGTFGDGPAPEHRYSDDRTFNVTLRVKDAHGTWSANVTRSVVVSNLPPKITALPPEQTIIQGVAANFTAEATDPDDPAGILRFEWDFGDISPRGSGSKVSHIYSSPGTYNVTAKVIDDDGAYSSVNIKVIVQKKATPKPRPEPNNNGAAAAAVIILIVAIVAIIGAVLYLRGRKQKSAPAVAKDEPIVEETRPSEPKVDDAKDEPSDRAEEEQLPEDDGR